MQRFERLTGRRAPTARAPAPPVRPLQADTEPDQVAALLTMHMQLAGVAPLVPVPMHAERGVPVPMHAERGVPVPMHAERGVPVPMHAERGVPVPMHAERGVPVPMHAERGVPVPMHAERGVPVPVSEEEQVRALMVQYMRAPPADPSASDGSDSDRCARS
jgi:hypothetical protein